MQPKKTGRHGVSVVICTHNGSQRLKRVIESVLRQKVPPEIPWEIVVADNASTDNSSQTAEEILSSQDLVRYRIVSETMLGLVYARIKGIEESTYEFVAFVDDDNSIESGWVHHAYSIMASNARVGVCGGMNEPAFESPKPDWFERFQSSFGTGPQGHEGDITRDKGYVFGAGMIIRKTAWNEVRRVFNGFFPKCPGRQGSSLTLGDDNEICYAVRALGWQIHYDPRLKLHHYLSDERLTKKYLFEAQKRYGMATAVLDAYFLARDSKIKRSWIWQSTVTLLKLLFFIFSFFWLLLVPWFSNARLETRLRIVRHSSRLKELLTFRKRYIADVQDVQERLKKRKPNDAF